MIFTNRLREQYSQNSQKIETGSLPSLLSGSISVDSSKHRHLSQDSQQQQQRNSIFSQGGEVSQQILRENEKLSVIEAKLDLIIKEERETRDKLQKLCKQLGEPGQQNKNKNKPEKYISPKQYPKLGRQYSWFDDDDNDSYDELWPKSAEDYSRGGGT